MFIVFSRVLLTAFVKKREKGRFFHFSNEKIDTAQPATLMNFRQVPSQPKKCERQERTSKRKKAPGTDEITNEILLLLLEFELTFFLMLDMFNKCWTDAVQPTEWQIAKL